MAPPIGKNYYSIVIELQFYAGTASSCDIEIAPQVVINKTWDQLYCNSGDLLAGTENLDRSNGRRRIRHTIRAGVVQIIPAERLALDERSSDNSLLDRAVG